MPEVPRLAAPPSQGRPSASRQRPQSAGSIRRPQSPSGRPQSAGSSGLRPLDSSGRRNSAGSIRAPLSPSGGRGPSRTGAWSALESERKPLPIPLTPVPVDLATPLEQQFAEVLGLGSTGQALRLPGDVGSCNMGSRCCWRWMARAAIEQAAEEPTGHLSLAEAVAVVKEELQLLRDRDEIFRQGHELCGQLQRQAKENAEKMARLTQENEENRKELAELRLVREMVHDTQAQNTELRADNARRVNVERGLNKIVASLQAQQHLLLEGDLKEARQHTADAERQAASAERQKTEAKLRLETSLRDNEILKVEVARLQRMLVNTAQKKGPAKRSSSAAAAKKKTPSSDPWGKPNSSSKSLPTARSRSAGRR